jgi:hypothetical protein
MSPKRGLYTRRATLGLISSVAAASLATGVRAATWPTINVWKDPNCATMAEPVQRQ